MKENNKDRVNHPSYYEKDVKDDRDHPECIDLLEVITNGLPGIIAMEIGQLKYLYRFGSKAEEGLSKKQKALEDVNKVLWYAIDAKKRLAYGDYNEDMPSFPSETRIMTIARLIAEEFAFDKPKEVKNEVRGVIYAAYQLGYGSDIDRYIDAVQKLVEAVENTTEEVWN